MKQLKRQENVKIRPGTTHESKGVSLPSRSSVSLQPELEMTQPGDAYEQEADWMADRITDHAFAAGAPTSRVSRPAISRAPSGYASVSVSPSLESAISSSRGGGFSMPPALKARMESGFGADFSQVRLHTDSSAARMSSSIRANAFTSGNDIYFASGKYDPSSRSGQHLIAHELTHTLQQSGKVARESSDGETTSVALPVTENIYTRLAREKKEADNKENKCQLYLFYILMHDPEMEKHGLSEKDAKTVCRKFSYAINNPKMFDDGSWKLEKILDEEGVKSVDTDWVTDYLDDKYHIFKRDYESALERAMEVLAEERLIETYLTYYNPREASSDRRFVKVYNPSVRADIYRFLLGKAEQEKFSPAPYRRYLQRKYDEFTAPVLARTMTLNDAQAEMQKRKEELEKNKQKEIKEKEDRENKEYKAFLDYLILRFFPEGDEKYRDSVKNRVYTKKDLEKAFGYSGDEFDASDRDTKQILRIWEAMMDDLAGKKARNKASKSEMDAAYEAVWNDAAVMDDERFKGLERFVNYEKQLHDYVKKKNWHPEEYFELPDTFVSAETYTRIFFTVMTTALSFIPVGAFAGMSGGVAKAAMFFKDKVIPRLIDVALNESYDKAGTNRADMDLLTQALSLGVETFFGKLPAVCESKVGKLIEGAAKDSLQSMVGDSSGYLVKYAYGEDVGDWAMVTTQNAMKTFVKSLGVGIYKEAHKSIAFRSDVKKAGEMTNQANLDLKQGSITQDQFNARMAEVDEMNAEIGMKNDFAVDVEGAVAGAVDNALGVSDAIEKKILSQDTVASVMVVPIYELMTIDDLSFPSR